MNNAKNTECRIQNTEDGSQKTGVRRQKIPSSPCCNLLHSDCSPKSSSVSSVLNPVVAPPSFVSSCLRGESSSSSVVSSCRRGEIPPSSPSVFSVAKNRRGFTLIELLVVISIIAILMAILLPALSSAINSGYSAATEAELGAIRASCLSYYSAFNAYPGPFSESDISKGYVTIGGNKITGTQNLVLGLMGTVYPTGQTPPTGVTTLAYTGSTSGVSGGYVDLTPGSGPIDYSNNGVQKSAYYNPSASSGDLQTFPTLTPAGATFNTLPTLFDDFPAGVPILYFRKVPGMPGTTGVPVGTDSGTAAAFYLNCNSTYTQQNIISTKNNSQTSEQYSSFNPTATNGSSTIANNALANDVVNINDLPAGTAVNAVGNPVVGGFVLISAGADHIYGQNLNGITAGNQAPASDDVVVYGGQ